MEMSGKGADDSKNDRSESDHRMNDQPEGDHPMNGRSESDQRMNDQHARQLSALVADLFELEAIWRHADRYILSLRYRFQSTMSRKMLQDRLHLAGYKFDLRDAEGRLVLDIDPSPRLYIPPINIILFVLTLISVYFVPVFFKHLGVVSSVSEAMARTVVDLKHGAGIEFTAAIISILFIHEMGHFVASRRRGIITSWPYFIPAPNIIGTFGAIIKSRSPFWNRRDLIEVGAAGPIAGWIVALGWLVWGLSQSEVLPISAVAPGDTALLFTLEGESILMRILAPLLTGTAPAGHSYLFTEAAFAGWVGLLITAINLLPIGQLDGGHILYGMGRKVQRSLGWVAMIALGILGLQSMMWWVFAGFGLIFGVAHPPTLNDARQISPQARVMGIIAVIIFILSFTPVPFRT